MMKRTLASFGLLAILSTPLATQAPDARPAFEAADIYVRGRSANAKPSMVDDEELHWCAGRELFKDQSPVQSSQYRPFAQ